MHNTNKILHAFSKKVFFIIFLIKGGVSVIFTSKDLQKLSSVPTGRDFFCCAEDLLLFLLEGAVSGGGELGENTTI